MNANYINPFTDFGFKKLFGQESGKEFLTEFLNSLLPSQHQIQQLTFGNTDRWSSNTRERDTIFNLHCETAEGHPFTVEIQKATGQSFKNRAVFYSTFPLREQAEKGEWNFKMDPVYCIVLLDFTVDDERPEKNHISSVRLKDQYGQTFYEHLNYIFIEMPRFTRTEEQLESQLDKWLYFLEHLESFAEIPDMLSEDIFLKGFDIARIEHLNEKERAEYQRSLTLYRESRADSGASFEEGEEYGTITEKYNIARRMKKRGADIEFIMEITHLSTREIENL
ncbi:MAG: Rpn family recombination-promoting nuclease/putative transposase [bacterium]|nr:Rpn family recombination-promoting nuclease/putative transposase [bacterium]